MQVSKKAISAARLFGVIRTISRSAGFMGGILALVAAGVLFIPPAVMAQANAVSHAGNANYSSITGAVTDAGGFAVSGADVNIENLETKKALHATTDSAGAFTIKQIPPGQYKLQTTKEGYKTFLVRTMPLIAGDLAKASIKLQVGSPLEVVEGSTTTVVSSAGFALAGKELSDLPENMRNVINMAQLSVGANEGSADSADQTDKAGTNHVSSAISVAGQLENLNNYLINDVPNTGYYKGVMSVFPSVDAVAEMQVLAASIPASGGITTGGVINVITKAGGKKYHGGAFEYLRNDDFDAYHYLFGAAPFKPEVRQNQFGGSVGGPIWKNKTYFFVGYEGFRLITPRAVMTLTVPTQYEHDHPGDFTDIGGKNYNALGLTDPAGLLYFQLYPAPNSGSSQYVAAPRGQNNMDSIDARIDHRLTSKDKFSGFVSYNNMTLDQNGYFPTVQLDGMSIDPGGNATHVFGHETTKAYLTGIRYTHTFRENLLLNLLVGRTTYLDNGEALNPNTPVNKNFGMPNINTSQSMNGLAPINVLKGTLIGDAGYEYPSTVNSWMNTLKGSVEWKLKKHDFTFGAGLIDNTWGTMMSIEGLGEWTVADLPSLVQGNYSNVIRNLSLVFPHYQFKESSIYAQDEWKVLKNLHFSLGVRYDVMPPFTEEHNQLANFDPNKVAIILAGVNGVSSTTNVPTDYSGIVPRFGFSWGIGKSTVLHGSYGIVTRNMATMNSQYNSPPFAYSLGPCSPTTCGASFPKLSSGLPAITQLDPSNPTGPLAYARSQTNMKNISMQLINFGVDRTLGKYDTVHANYVGSLGRHLTRYFNDLNAPPPNTLGAKANSLRPFYSKLPNVTSISFADAEGASSYNSLQAVYQHNTKFGVSGQMSYAWTHAMDNARTWPMDATGYGNVISETATRDYGNSDFDVRNRIVSIIKYAVPFGKSAEGFKKVAETGWSFNVTEVWSTGLPFTVLNASDVSNTNISATNANSDRSNVVGNPNLPTKSNTEFFNTAAFQAQTLGTLGNEGRNQYYGPHVRHVDISLLKDFPVERSLTGQFRVEAFNVTNTATFAAPAKYLNGANFGRLTGSTSSYTPREIQVVLRLQF